jgi:hypothetical protein
MDIPMRNRTPGRGEAALRIAKRFARRNGDTELAAKLDHILASDELAAIAGAAIEDEAGGGLFRFIIEWITAHPDEFAAFLEWIIGLFAGSLATPETDQA